MEYYIPDLKEASELTVMWPHFFLAHKLYKNSLFSSNQDFYASQWHLNPMCYRGVSSWIQHSSCAFFIFKKVFTKALKDHSIGLTLQFPQAFSVPASQAMVHLHITRLSRKPFPRETGIQKLIETFLFLITFSLLVTTITNHRSDWKLWESTS